ncbi:MAG: hypothetical protein ACI8RZ_006563 [Myxococcota bacterium]|jgi:hypothetical protein
MRIISLLLLVACRSKDAAVDTDELDTDTTTTIDADGDGYDTTEDCDDGSSQVSPGAEELCDGIDNNCDGSVDEGVTDTFYADADGDGFGDAGDTAEACETPSGYVATATDCQDDDAESYPGAAERCDEVDNDCDGEIDEDVRYAWYADADADGYGDPDSEYETCDPPPGYVSDDTDCDDTEAAAYPGGFEVCDEVDNDCNGTVDEDVTTTYYQDTDADGFGVADTTTSACDLPTGYAADPGDCDDADGTISPNAAEVCDGVDNDCDGDTDTSAIDASIWYADDDADGFGNPDRSATSCDAPSGSVDNAEDCDDTDSAIHPDAAEVCDEQDNDCNGWTDDADPGVTDASTWYIDADGDTYGSTTYSTDACDQPTGYVADATDCDDGEASAYPGGSEVCDGADNDCDGSTDEDASDAETFYADVDADGYGDPDSTAEDCEAPSGYVVSSDDCDDGEASTNPGGEEVCDGADNDCDGSVDEDASDAETFYADVDGDGYGSASYTASGCEAPSGYVTDATDCDDTEAAAYPGATEVCDGVDNDCDGDTDSDSADITTYYADVDADGYGDPDSTAEDCEVPSGYVTDATDCDDSTAAVNPDAEEVCDGLDNDCDGTSDDGTLGAAEDCAAADCLEILDAGDDDGDGLYWIDPDGDGADAWEAYCDMTNDGGGWTKLYSSLYPTWWSVSDWEDVGAPEDDDYSALAWRDDFADSGVWTFRFQVGNSSTWDVGTVEHYTVWSQEHDPFDDSTDGSDYTYVDGEESTTCSGFNGLHDQYYLDHGTYALSSDVDSGDSYGCWWMQIVPLTQYSSASTYPGYLEGYDGPNVHTWHVLWVQ